MTAYVIKRTRDGMFLTRYGFSTSEAHAQRFESMTEAEIKILSDGLSECQVIPVEKP